MKIKNGTALFGECLEEMDKLIEQGVKVDAIITDPPYGTTACKWDSVIPFEAMWERLNKLIKPNGAIVLFGSQPFTSALIMSNTKSFKYEWIYEKNAGSNFGAVRFQPMKEHENILIFGLNRVNYYPIKQKRSESGEKRVLSSSMTYTKNNNNNYIYGDCKKQTIKKKAERLRFPRSVQKFNRERGLHPTQKPVALMEYLIKTYTNEGETVLDFTAGSFTTAVACENTNRKWIAIENDENYFKIGTERVSH